MRRPSERRIQALERRVDELTRDNKDLRAENKRLKTQIKKVEREMDKSRRDGFITTNFWFAFREFAVYARICICGAYNAAPLPRGLAKLNAKSFFDGFGVDEQRLKAAFTAEDVPYALYPTLKYAIAKGDGIAHKFNRSNHADLDRLQRDMRFVNADLDWKDSFKELAKVWKRSLSAKAAFHREARRARVAMQP